MFCFYGFILHFCDMKIIAAKKNNILYFGSVTKIAKLINVWPSTICRWIKAKEEIRFENGFEVYINTKKL